MIDSLNQDKPYDRFVQEQIAGDELWPADPAAHIATGFNSHYPDESNARVLQQRRQEILDDITDTTGLVFLGLTMGCAQCHDHKFDAILQTDYFRLQALFTPMLPSDTTPVATPEQLREYNEKLAAYNEASKEAGNIELRLPAQQAPPKPINYPNHRVQRIDEPPFRRDDPRAEADWGGIKPELDDEGDHITEISVFNV